MSAVPLTATRQHAITAAGRAALDIADDPRVRTTAVGVNPATPLGM
jgi:hypothetical protein